MTDTRRRAEDGRGRWGLILRQLNAVSTHRLEGVEGHADDVPAAIFPSSQETADQDPGFRGLPGGSL